MIPALNAIGRAILSVSPEPTFANVKFLMYGDVYPWYDSSTVLAGGVNYSASLETTIKPSWAAGSCSNGTVNSASKKVKFVELGSNYMLGTSFCLDAFVYCSSSGARIFDTRPTTSSTSGWIMSIQATTLFPVFQCNNAGVSVIGTTGVTANTWTHVRINYDGTSLRIFVNGTRTDTSVVSINITTGTDLNIADINVEPSAAGIGNQYLYGLRIVKGEYLTTSNFIAPTYAWPSTGNVIALQTNVTYANAVLRSTYDSTVADQSTFAHTMTAAGNAVVSSGVSKFGGASLLLDGTGDYVSTPDSTDFDLGTGDYQFQGWFYRNGTKANDPTLISCYVDSTHGYSISMNKTTFVPYFNATGDGIDGVFIDGLASNTTWYHVAVGRKNGILYTFVNGVLQQFIADTQTTNCNGTMFIGRANNSFTSNDWLGSIDDLQLVKGECQLTRSFLVPTAALPTS